MTPTEILSHVAALYNTLGFGSYVTALVIVAVAVTLLYRLLGRD